ncbi:MAG: hypothetical protein FWH34_07980, partial [Desulfovibrionaceae bacterium]|nr:hypothetical protein [Desulfovibrionaceae bacterium]
VEKVFIPASGLAKGAQLAGMTGRQVFTSSIKPGIIAGAAGNFASANIAALDLNRKGEDLGFQDVMLETMFGAIAGPFFHAGGAFLGRRAARKGIRSSFEGLRDALPEGESAEISRAVEAMKKGDAAAYAQYGKALEDGAGFGSLREASEFLRTRVTPEERMEIARVIELAIHDLREGRPIDVSSVLRESALLRKAWNMVKAEIDARTPAGKPDEVLVLLEPQGQESMGVQRGPMAVLPDGTVGATGTEVGRQAGSRSGYGLTKAIIKHPDVTRADAASIPRIMREYEPISPDNQGHKGRTWIVERHDGRQLVIGEAKQPDGGMLVTLHIHEAGKARPLSQRKGPAEKSLDGSAPQRFSAVEADTGGGFPPRRSRSHQDETIIVRDGEDVNAAIARQQEPPLDWRVASPEVHEPLPPVSKEAPNILHETGIDPETGISLDEAALTHLEAEGRLLQADKDSLLAHTAESERINKLEEQALSVAECVMKVGV